MPLGTAVVSVAMLLALAAEPDPVQVAEWSARVLEAPVALVQGVSPTNAIGDFPSAVVVPGTASPFDGMTVEQAGWLDSSMPPYPGPGYEIDLARPDGVSGQWLGFASRAYYDYQLDDSSCVVLDGSCGTRNDVVFEEQFLIPPDQPTPIVVRHWGNFAGGFEYWAASWYAEDLGASYAFLISGPAPQTAPLEVSPPRHRAAAERFAELARSFVPWTP